MWHDMGYVMVMSELYPLCRLWSWHARWWRWIRWVLSEVAAHTCTHSHLCLLRPHHLSPILIHSSLSSLPLPCSPSLPPFVPLSLPTEGHVSVLLATPHGDLSVWPNPGHHGRFSSLAHLCPLSHVSSFETQSQDYEENVENDFLIRDLIAEYGGVRDCLPPLPQTSSLPSISIPTDRNSSTSASTTTHHGQPMTRHSLRSLY